MPFFPRFGRVPPEPAAEREQRLRAEMRRFPGIRTPITAIPYEYVGNDIRALYLQSASESLKLNYPDWHLLTPAYRLRFAGMTWSEHAGALFSYHSGNNLLRRAIRWWEEDKVVIYSDRLDKLSSVASMIVLVGTFALTCSQMIYDAPAQCAAVNGDGGSLAPPSNLLTRLSTLWSLLKLLVSGIPGGVIAFNAFKRTTLPKSKVVILSFRDGTIEQPKKKKKNQRVSPLIGRPSASETMSSIKSPTRRRTLSLPGFVRKVRLYSMAKPRPSRPSGPVATDVVVAAN